jgi:lipoprotein-releasing system ATP-binding protein
MLVGENIYKNFGEIAVLNGVSLTVKPSEICSIVGASGAGKSTLLHILGTLDKPDKGIVLLGEKDLHKLDAKSLEKCRNRDLGFVFQFHNLMAELSALENVSLPALISGKNKKKAEEDALELLETLGLGHRVKHLPSELSGGEMQRVAVARALINKPKFVFADEPSGNLDSKNASDLHRLFFELRNKYGFGMVIVTHNNDLARQSDRVFELKDGALTN